MRIKSKRLMVAAFAVALAAPVSALATNGYFVIGFGAGSVGMGGIGVTSPQDALCVGGNPACLGEFTTPQFSMGVGLFNPPRRAGTTVMAGSNGEYERSDVNLYAIPGMGFVFPFNDNLSLGFAALGNGGAGTTFKPNFFGGGRDYLGVDLVQLIVPITVAYKINPTNTFGFSVVPARQRFLAQGLENFAIPAFSSDPSSVTGKGHDYANGMGVRGGWTGHYFGNKVTLGATYASKVFMHKLTNYRGLFAGEGSFDIPANYAIGIGIKPTENLTVALDIQKILYSDVPSVGNRGPDPSGNLPNAAKGTLLGSPRGSGFGWKDQTVYKLGVAYSNAFPTIFGENKLTLRTGFNYGKTPIQQDQLLFNLLAPATTEKHVTMGFTYSLGDQSILGFGSEGLLTMAFTRAYEKKMEGPVVGTGGERGIAGFAMYQNVLDIAYTLKF